MSSPNLAPIAGAIIDADLLRALAATNRSALERMIAIGIDILDQTDPDPDLEEDDPVGQCDEDELNTSQPRGALHGGILDGAGCILSDDDVDEGYRPLWATREGRAFANARRARLGLSLVGRR